MSKSTNPIKTPLRAIRANCIECSCGSKINVRLCPSKTCPLWGYRMGHRPTPSDIRDIAAAFAKVELAKEKECNSCNLNADG